MPNKPDILVPGVLLAGRYLVGGLLGQGGFGATYRGYDERLATLVAIKEFFLFGSVTRANDGISLAVTGHAHDTFEYIRSKFLDEARTLAKLRSITGVVSVFDFFEENNTAYIIMEFLSGITLKQLQAKRKDLRLPIQSAVPIFCGVLSALSEIHGRDILHRDISPDNILIDGKGGVKLLDFGAARQALSATDQRMTVILKPGYAPLEQYSEKSNHGPWSDLYAAGATFYMLLSGTKPPPSLDRMMNDEIKPLSDFGVNAPPNVTHAIMKALSVQPRERWQTAAAFAEEMRDKSTEALAETPNLLQAHCTEQAHQQQPSQNLSSATVLRHAEETGGTRTQAHRPASINIDERIGQPISTIELRKCLEEHTRFLAGKPNGRRLNLSMRSLGGLKLGALNLTGAELTGTSFARCDLSGANFTNANLFCADLTGANLTRAKFIKCDLRGARFDGAELSGSTFEGADCREGIMLVQRKDGHLRDVKDEGVKRVASFANAIMSGAVLRNANLGSAQFEKATLESADFSGADLKGANMGGAVLKNAKFEKANLFDCDFTQANLEGVDTSTEEFSGAKIVRQLHEIEKTLQEKIIEHQKWVESLSHKGKRLVLKNGDLSGLQMGNVDWSAAELLVVNMTDINLQNAKISMTDFSGSVLQGAILRGADARGAKFRSCNIKNADFSGANLSPVISGHGKKWGSNFAKSDLRGSKFEATECEGADFSDTNLSGASFRNAVLKQANFTGANIDGVDFTNATINGVIGLKV